MWFPEAVLDIVKTTSDSAISDFPPLWFWYSWWLWVLVFIGFEKNTRPYSKKSTTATAMISIPEISARYGLPKKINTNLSRIEGSFFPGTFRVSKFNRLLHIRSAACCQFVSLAVLSGDLARTVEPGLPVLSRVHCCNERSQ